jgi:NADPH:quinone reductase-like Zn-dependent oxidoreductase
MPDRLAHSRVVRFQETGAPAVLRIEEEPTRVPAADEVLIRVEAIGLNRAEAVRFIARGMAEGQLNPLISKSFSLDEIVAAHRYLESNQQIGKIVVTTGSESHGRMMS